VIRSRSIAKVILVVVGVLVALYFLFLIRRVIGAVFIAVFLAVALGPAVDFFQRRRLPRGLAILVVYVLLFLAVFGVGLLIVPPIVDEVDQLVAEVPTYVDDLRGSETFREYDDRYEITKKLTEQSENLPSRLGDAAGALQSVTVGVFSALFQLITILVMTFFLLLDGRRMVEFALRQLDQAREKRARAAATNIYRAVGGYVVGAFSIAATAGVTAYFVMLILGIPFAVPLAVMMAFLGLIPLIGATIAGVLILGVAAAHDFPTAFIAWGIFFIVYQQVENNVLQPFIYKRTVALHPLLVIIAVLIGASLLGVLGALLAIPIAAALQILVKDAWHFRAHPGSRSGAEHTGDSPVDPPDLREEDEEGGDDSDEAAAREVHGSLDPAVPVSKEPAKPKEWPKRRNPLTRLRRAKPG